MGLDLKDSDAIFDFVRSYGWFCRPGWQGLPHRDLQQHFDGAGPVHEVVAAVEKRLAQRRAGNDFCGEGWRYVPGHYEQSGDGTTNEPPGADLVNGPSVLPLGNPWAYLVEPGSSARVLDAGEVAVHALFLRNATLVWDMLTDGRSVEQLVSDWEGPFGPSSLRGLHFLDGLVEDFEPDEESLYRDAVAYLQRTLNACLAEFQVHIDVAGLGEGEPAREPTLYAAMGLQLADHIARRIDYKRCKNEKCHRLFVRQRGRATTGRYHQEGVKYCSKECASRQTQRQYRRKRARPSKETDS